MGSGISTRELALLKLRSVHSWGCLPDLRVPGCARFIPIAISCPDRWSTAKGRRPSFYPYQIALAIALSVTWGPAGRSGYAQDSHKSKVPGLDKIASGSSRLAFSGNIQSFDQKRELLSVNTVQGGTTEVFPLKKGVHVSAANGARLNLDNLKPGANVLVYYEQKAEKRTVTEIIVLSSGASQGQNKPAPPS